MSDQQSQDSLGSNSSEGADPGEVNYEQNKSKSDQNSQKESSDSESDQQNQDNQPNQQDQERRSSVFGRENFDPFQLAEKRLAKIHQVIFNKNASLVYNLKELNVAQGNIDKCPCCFFPTVNFNQNCNQFRLGCDLTDLNELGSGFHLYFYQMKLAAYMMFVVALAGIACLVGNVSQYELDDTDSTINYLGPGTYGWDNEDIIYQPAMHMIAGIILMIFFPFFYFKLNGKAVEIDMDMITPADFTVWIKGLPSDYNDEELKNWIQSNFMSDISGNDQVEIVDIIPAYNIKDQIKVIEDIQRAKSMQQYVEQKVQANEKLEETSCCCCHTTLKTVQELETEIQEAETRQKEVFSRQEQEKKTGIVFVTLRTQTDARATEEFFSLNFFQKQYYRVLECLNRGGKQSFNGYFVTVKMAPEPNDIYWENLHIGFMAKQGKIIFTWFLLFLTLLGSFGALYGIGLWQNDLNDDSKDQDTISTIRILSAIPSVIVVLINFILARLARIFTSFEKHRTWTDFNLAVGTKLILAMFMNTGIIPLLVNAEKDRWFVSGGLVVDIFFIQLANIFVAPLIYLISPMYRIRQLKRRSLTKKMDKGIPHNVTQAVANVLFEGPEVDMANRNANMVKTYLISLAYSPFLPISPLIGIIGLFLEYWVCKWMLLRIHRRPKRHGEDLARQVYGWFEYGILIHAIYTYICFSIITEESNQITSIYLVIAVLYFIFPIKFIVRKCFKQEDALEILRNQYSGSRNSTLQEDNDYYKCAPKFLTVIFIQDYMRANPATAMEGEKRYIEICFQDAGEEDKVKRDELMQRFISQNLSREAYFQSYQRHQIPAEQIGNRMTGKILGNIGMFNKPNFQSQQMMRNMYANNLWQQRAHGQAGANLLLRNLINPGQQQNLPPIYLQQQVLYRNISQPQYGAQYPQLQQPNWPYNQGYQYQQPMYQNPQYNAGYPQMNPQYNYQQQNYNNTNPSAPPPGY